MPIVRMPDGTQVQFPDTMPPDQIKALIVKKFPQLAQPQMNTSGSPDDRSSVAPQLPTPPEPYNQSYLSQGLSGINEGIANGLGAPVDLVSAGLNLGSAGLNKFLGTNIPPITDPFGGANTFRSLLAPTITPPTQDPNKQMVRRTAQEIGATLLPGAVTSDANLALMGGQLGLSALGGLGAATSQRFLPGNQTAELAGEALGSFGGAGLAKLGQKLITPFAIPAARQAAIDTLQREGVSLTAGQKTGSNALKYAESELGGSAAANMAEKQGTEFTAAALRQAGVAGNRATPDVVAQGFRDIGHRMDTLAANNIMPMDGQLSTDLGQTVRDYNSLVNPSQRAPIIQSTLQDLVNAAKANGNSLDGVSYQALRSRLDRAARGTADPQLKTALLGIKTSLDDAMERGIAQNNPADLGEWKQARNDYRNMLVIEKAAGNGSGEAAAQGIISPAALKTATKAVQGLRSYARGTSDFSDLAHAGETTMKPLPQSGTAPRLAVRGLMGLPSAIGAVAGSPAGLVGSIAGATAGAAVPSLLGKAIMSRPGQAYLANQLLKRGPDLRSLAGPIGAILANQTGGTP